MTVFARRVGQVALSTAALSVVLTGCGADDDGAGEGGRLTVVAGFYPLAYVAEQVGGDAVEVTNLTSAGVEPHDLELTPRQVGKIVDADLVLTLSGFQPAVDDAIAQNEPARILDVGEVVPADLDAPDRDHDEGDADGDHSSDDHAEGSDEAPAADPHVWLDPTRLAAVASAVADSLADIDPANASAYRLRATDLSDRLGDLDAKYAQGLATCERREFVTSHAAFGYLAARYDLRQIPISGISPEAEPSPARIQEIHAAVRNHRITTIFFETLVSPDLAEAIARDTGATTAVLDPIEGIQDAAHDDYFTVMEANLSALRKALSCT